MQQPILPSLIATQSAFAQLAPQEALEHLEAALRTLQGLTASLHHGDRLAPADQRQLERSLLRFRTELRDAAILADQGLAYCQDWAQQLQPPASYQPNGVRADTTSDRHEFSVEA